MVHPQSEKPDAIALIALMLLEAGGAKPADIVRFATEPAPLADANFERGQLREFGAITAPAASVRAALRRFLQIAEPSPEPSPASL